MNKQELENAKTKLGLTQQRMADIACVNITTVQKWLSGQHKVNPLAARIFSAMLLRREREGG